MYVDFKELPDSSRLWIYQSAKPVKEGDRQAVVDKLRAFTDQWLVHGQPLKASYQLLDDHFILLAVDENFNSISGCSIDSSVHLIREIDKQAGTDFFTRDLIPFRISGEIVYIPLKQLKQKYSEGVWNGQTQTFNILANTLKMWRAQWEISAEKTWLKRYMVEMPTAR